MSFHDDTSRISPPPLGADVPSRAPGRDGEGHVVEVGGMRIPLDHGQWYDGRSDEIVGADGRRIKRTALAGAE